MEESALPTKESIREVPEYCCPAFQKLHDEGVLLYVHRVHQSKFVVTGSYLEHCPFCFKAGYPI